MANPEHLAILKQGVEKWNQWRKEYHEIIPDLSFPSFRGINLFPSNLNRSEFSGADLTRANLSGADLTRANLSKANLSEANLRVAKLGSADLRGANLSGADLGRSNLRRANLSEANLSEANLSEANLFEAYFSESCLSEAGLRWANLRWADLSGADLRRANLSGANLSGADLRRAIVGWTILGDNDLSSVKGLDTVKHEGPSIIGIDTIYKSGGKIPDVFLRGCGVPETFITFAKSLVNSPIEFYSCFISYSSRNQDFAERLYADLQSNGVRCWYAPEDLKIGDKFRVRIDESIWTHEKLLLILSKDSVGSQWVEKEVETAMERERQQWRDSEVLFPITLDDAILNEKSGWAGDIRRNRHIGDFRGWKNHDEYRKAFDRLLRDLRAESARREGDAAGAETVTG